MLSVRGVSQQLGGKSVLEAINLDVAPGTFLTLLGPSGCGKTTLLRILAGFLRPHSGTVTLNGKILSAADVVVPPERRGMGMVFQNYAVWPHMTVTGNVAYGLKVRRLPNAEIRARANEALRLVGLLGFERRIPSELSGGQQQRVSIARSIATTPNVLLLDEPLSNLDAKLRKDMLFDLKRIQQESGVTFFYVTHDQSEALSVSDQVVVMKEGRIMQIGSPREVYDQPKNLFVASFVGNANTLRGRIVSAGDDETIVQWSDNGKLVLAKCENVSDGAIVDVAVKRHGVRISSPHVGMDELQILGKVRRTYFLGQSDEVSVDIGGQEIFGFTPAGLFSAGETVAVRIEPGTYQLFIYSAGPGNADSQL
jgi:ABC-type Fe3+/spermidine/putrescine transport system ATPase subunit